MLVDLDIEADILPLKDRNPLMDTLRKVLNGISRVSFGFGHLGGVFNVMLQVPSRLVSTRENEDFSFGFCWYISRWMNDVSRDSVT